MKNFTKLFVAAIAIIGFSATANAQESATASSSATIITPISITKDVDMNFGNVAVQSTTGGTVVLAPAGTRTKTGGVTLPATTGTVAAAAFTVNGQAGYTYAITLPGTINLTSGVNTMSLGTFTSTPSSTGTLTAGTQVVNVGGTLTVAAAQPAGSYTNTTGLTVTVNYN